MKAELTTEQVKEATRFFELKRRIYDDSNIKDNYDYKEYKFSWIYSAEIYISNLTDQDIFALVVILYDARKFGTPSRIFKEAFGWDKKKVYNLAKNEQFIYSTTLFREDDGLIAGRGYVIEHSVSRRMDELYKEFLWNDISEEIPKCGLLLFDVDIPEVFKGQLKGVFHSDKTKVQVNRPEYVRYNEIPNWPKDGYFPKGTLTIDKSNVKRWKIIY
ncbi:hypothetical protein [Dysgonomonas termitidis]|uniref:Uncharacterized protein n=1 Tax=Dysgonomonas termitidis TaxID=1516126 RepID=A0ABV9L105_9BACT